MEPFRILTGICVPLDRPDIDTDQILPARYLPLLRSEGFGPCLFRDLRFDANGKEREDFVLNVPPYRGASIIVAGHNFGCGSSREAAVYALCDYGIRAVIAASFGDIFYSNCMKNGLLPIALTESFTGVILAATLRDPGIAVTIDLPDQQVVGPEGIRSRFHINSMHKSMLLNGIDEIEYTLGLGAEIATYERKLSRSGPSQ